MSRLVALLFLCGGVLVSAEAECEGQNQQDDVGLLQTMSRQESDKQAMGASEAQFEHNCPEECSEPHCNSGNPRVKGWQSLQHGTCYFLCSKKFRKGRFCGEGKNFQEHGFIDCTRCRPRTSGGKSADFAFTAKKLGTISGKFSIDVVEQKKHEPLPKLVEWEVENLNIDAKVVEKACGKLLKGKPTFNYHLHEEWNFPEGQTSSAFDCSLANVGNHWDPTAACGPASGNPVCDEGFCNTRGKNYTCDKRKFDPFSIMQYRLLSPSRLAPDGVTCEFGDFSGMTGPVEAELNSHTGGVHQRKPHDGRAAMSASFGEINPHTLDGRPYLSCQFGTLPKQGKELVTYDFATVRTPLDQFPEKASVLVHCGDNYENANARFFCALLEEHH